MPVKLRIGSQWSQYGLPTPNDGIRSKRGGPREHLLHRVCKKRGASTSFVRRVSLKGLQSAATSKKHLSGQARLRTQSYV